MKASLALLVLLCLSGIAQGQLIISTATLDGPSEFPVNASPGTGFATVTYDTIAHTLELDVTFSGLLGTTTASHIHAPTVQPLAGAASVATTTPTFAGFPLGVTSGTYQNTLDLTLASSFNASYVTANGGTVEGAETALINAISDGKAYLNIHSTSFPGGEIRGFLVVVPEPSSTCAIGAGILGAFALVRRFRGAGQK
jgi:hypothetical protein